MRNVLLLIASLMFILSGQVNAQCAAPVPMLCDADGDQDVDLNDIQAITDAKGTNVESGDVRDIDGDGEITLVDARRCVASCDHPQCTEDSWPTYADAVNEAVEFSYPPEWETRASDGKIVVSNVEKISEISTESLQNESYFEVRIRYNANPDGLTVSEWFDSAIRPMALDILIAESIVTVDSKEAFLAEVVEPGGRSLHYFISSGNDVVEVYYPLYSPKFIPSYTTILESLKLSP
jgi:hypothetical protein